MNEKEIAEIRRRFRPEKNNITHIRGCYVNEKRELVSTFHESLLLMPKEAAENMLGVLKKSLSGTIGKNLLDIRFETAQVVDSEEHRLLMALKSSALKDEEAVTAFFTRAAESIFMEGSYLILLAADSYDIPFRGKDGATLEDASSEQYSYLLCSVCPVKTTKPVLSYYVPENTLQNCGINWLVGAPELGFLFPAFDDRSANIYGALYYSRDTADVHGEFLDTIFHCPLPMPAAVQKECFQSILAESLGTECNFEMVHSVHAELAGMIEEHKANKEVAPLVVSKKTVKHLLENCGVAEEKLTEFETRYDSDFGAETEVNPKNLIDVKQFELRTPDVVIRVNPERSDLVQTRMIGGTQYILIRAEEGVELNGVGLRIATE